MLLTVYLSITITNADSQFVIMNKDALLTVNKGEKICQRHFSDFRVERRVSASSRLLNDIVEKNNLAL